VGDTGKADAETCSA